MKIFISGPYSSPHDPMENVVNAIHVGNQIVEMGHVPFIPHLYHLWEKVTPHNYEYWMHLCLSWLKSCDAILRLPGKSPGADREVILAAELGLDLFYQCFVCDWFGPAEDMLISSRADANLCPSCETDIIL